MRGGGTVSEALQRNYAHFGSKQRADGRIVWKRDPNLVKGFIPTELCDPSLEDPMSDHLYSGRRQHDRAAVRSADAARGNLPAVQIMTMPKLGDYPHQEAPEEYIRIVQTFSRAGASDCPMTALRVTYRP